MTDLPVCPSIVVESVGLVVDVKKLSDSQLDVYRTVVVLLNLCQTIKFAGNFVFYARPTYCGDCAGGDRRAKRDQSGAMALYRFRTADAACRSTQQAFVTNFPGSTEMIVSNTWPDHRRHVVPTTRTVASV